MPERTFNTTAGGWPVLDNENYVDAIVDWSVQLTNKLQNGEAAVPRAENAATRAEAAAASVPKIAFGSISMTHPGGTANPYVSINYSSAGFTQAPKIMMSANGSTGMEQGIQLKAMSQTTTTARIYGRGETSTPSYAFIIDWVAVGS